MIQISDFSYILTAQIPNSFLFDFVLGFANPHYFRYSTRRDSKQPAGQFLGSG